MRRIQSYFISKVFLLPASCNFIQKSGCGQKSKDRLYLLTGLCESVSARYTAFIFYIYCRSTKLQYSVCCRGTDKTREKDGLQHIWLSDNTIRSAFYYTAVLCCIVLLRFYFISATPPRVNSPVFCSAAGREQVKVRSAAFPDNLQHAQVQPRAAPIKEQFRWFMQRACAGCSIFSHSFLHFPVWLQLVRMKNRGSGDTNSSCVISWCGFTEVVNPCFALYQPSAGIFSLTATFCHPWWLLIWINTIHASELPRYRFHYWLTWWMLAASITPNCWIWMRLIRSPPKMTFVFSVFWSLLS